MKYTYLFLPVLLLAMACGDSKDTTKEDGTSTKAETPTTPSETTPSGPAPVDLSNKAVLLWETSISSSTAKDKKWVSTYQFGNTLTLTGKSEDGADGKKYLEVTGPDGKSGWISDYLVATNASVGVAVADVTLYKNPDNMSISSSKLNAGDIVALSAEDKGGFRMVYTREKKTKGYINTPDKVSGEAIDLKVAVLYQRALAQKTPEEKVKALKAIDEDGANASSRFLGLVRAKIQEYSPVEDMDVPSEGYADTTSAPATY